MLKLYTVRTGRPNTRGNPAGTDIITVQRSPWNVIK